MKKFTTSQHTAAAGPSQQRRPTKTTAPAGSHSIRPAVLVTVTASPVTGSAERMTASALTIAGMPSASTAHIDHTTAPPAMLTRWAVGTAENGYAAWMRP